MEIFLTIMMWIAFGCAGAYFAKKQKRNPYLWFFIGLFLGVFGLLLLLTLPLIQRLKSNSATPKREQEIRTVDGQPTSAFTLTSLLDQSFANTLWYYLDGANLQKGPMSFTAFERDWKEGKFASSAYIWNEKLSEWKRFEELFPTAHEHAK